jgi:thymidylate kinase
MRNLFIIVEGPDNVGKSTLIKNVKDYFNDMTLHNLHYSNVKQPSKEAVIEYSKKTFNEMFQMMEFQIRFHKSGIICDRSHLGEMIYGPIYRDYTGEFVLDIEKTYSNNISLWNNLFLITLVDEPENLIARDDGLSFSTDLEKKQTEIDNFCNAHNKSLIKNKLQLNIKDYDADAASKAVIEFIEGNKND